MDLNYIKNCVMNAPGLAIKQAESPLIKVGNTIRVKANGFISLLKKTSDCPSLSTSLGVNGVASTNLPHRFYRIYTLLAAVNPTTGAITYSWVHSDDIDYSTKGQTKWVNKGNAGDKDKAIIGFALVFNNSGSDFVPGTTALDADGITLQCIDHFGFIGM